MSLRSKLLIDKLNRIDYYKHEMFILLYKSIIYDKSLDKDFRFFVFLKLNKLQQNCSISKIRNRCIITSRSRGVSRFFKISRLQLRKLGGLGYITGLKRSSW